MLNKITVFFNLIKFEHSLFALPFAYLGLFLAGGGFPQFHIFLWVTVAMVAIRTSAMSLNRLIDQAIDEKNPRTKQRGDSLRMLRRPVVWVITFVSIAIFLVACAQLNPLCFALSPIPILFVWIYPSLKKITWLSHLFLGMILGIAPYGGWLAARAQWSWIPVLLVLAVAAWVSGFDMFYALQDVEFDRMENLKSFPVRFGVEKAMVAARWLHGVTLVALGALGVILRLGFWYWTGWLVIVGLIVREHRLVSRFGVGKINEAFFNMNAWVSVIIFIATAIDVTLS